jgi:hypothetical protein
MLGQDVVRAAEHAGHRVVALGHGELDVAAVIRAIEARSR